MIKSCSCGNAIPYQNCCEPFINGTTKPVTAEQLMRSRFSAYTIADADYLMKTTHISTRKFHRKSKILTWAKSNKWYHLKILESNENSVTFKAFFIDQYGSEKIHFEKSQFIFENRSWFYIDGEFE